MNVNRIGKVSVLAPAKLNLFLELLGKRADGFHELETVMVAVSIYDQLSFCPTDDESISFALDTASFDPYSQHSTHQQSIEESTTQVEPPALIPTGEDNIVVRALRRLQQEANVASGCKIRLTKRIPAQAGMGGASSDAAAAIWMASQCWQIDWPTERLIEFAGTLGSDIPFFFGLGSAICRGRGEIIEPFSLSNRLNLVVVKPPVGLSTPAVFRVCEIPNSPRSSAGLLTALTNGNLGELGKQIHNRLQPAAEKLTDWISRLEQTFQSLDCIGHGMSGSGSSYFGLFPHAKRASQIAQMLRTRNVGEVFAVQTVKGFEAIRP